MFALMPPTPSAPATATSPMGDVSTWVLVNSLGCGAACVALATAAAFGAGLVPAGAATSVLAGAGAALVANAGAVVLHGRVLDRRAGAAFARDARLMAGRMQSLLAASFLVKLAVLVVGVFALHRTGAKFEVVAAFAIAFATASLVCQLATVVLLTRTASRHRPAPPVAGEDPRAGGPAEA